MRKHFAISLACIYIGVFLLVSAERNFKKCLKKDGCFPKPESLCKSYYKCKDWVPVQKRCGFSEHFSPIKQECVPKESYPCFEKRKSIECPKENGRFLKAGSKCMTYYDCCNWKPKEKHCPKDQLFNPSSGRCECTSHYYCAEDLIHSTTEGQPTILSTTEDQSTILSTTEGQSTILSTTEGQSTILSTTEDQSTKSDAFSSSSTLSSTEPMVEETTSSTINESPETSTVEKLTEPSIKTSTIAKGGRNFTPGRKNKGTTEFPDFDEKDFVCPEPFGYFPHPSNRHQFVGCVNWVPSILTCPSDLIYKQDIGQCDYDNSN